MANELTINLYASITNGNFKAVFDANGQSITQTTLGGHAPVWIVGNGAEEDLAVGDVSTLGWLFMRNLDSTNYVTYGPKSAGSMVALGRIKAGETVAMRLEPGVTVRAQANTASVKVQVLLLEA